ncbi:MAG TPA: Gfo/Idh/MocA family oxidoreductase [Bryobacteraceae bacterium]|nr:Gfo/Idh/MocA family oxidoreductase [Bryobacteraceae bacterium]
MNDTRRDFVKTAAAAFTTQMFTGAVRGANDRIAVGFIGMGKMGRDNLHYAMRQPNAEAAAVCDVYDRNLNWAMEIAHGRARRVRDFHEILDDKSIDAVCVATPDHWHAYLTVEACKAGKDVYVEKPVSVTIDEATKMLEAARKYKRVVQSGTMQRSAEHFRKAVDLVRSGELGKVTFVRAWNYEHSGPQGIGDPPDSDPPAGLDWDMWLGPAPRRAFNPNRFGVDPQDRYFSRFRWFWDYAGGMMTDWGVHLLDIVQWAFDEAMPRSVTASGGKFYLHDNRETPDTLQVTYEYPEFIAVYENREGNAQSMFDRGYGILFHGERGTLFVDRRECRLVSEPGSTLMNWKLDYTSGGNVEHWANFLDCMRTRQKPASDIEICRRSTTTCHLGNIALRSRERVDFDAERWTVAQPEAKKYFEREYRAPWKLAV